MNLCLHPSIPHQYFPNNKFISHKSQDLWGISFFKSFWETNLVTLQKTLCRKICTAFYLSTGAAAGETASATGKSSTTGKSAGGAATSSAAAMSAKTYKQPQKFGVFNKNDQTDDDQRDTENDF